MWFMMMYELPWILKWTYNFVENDGDSWGYIPQLETRIFNHWWDKFHLDHLKPSSFQARKVLPDRLPATELPPPTPSI